jgi:hypothetical protein
MKLFTILILSILFAVTSQGKSWECRNDMEITCSNGKCEAKIADGFTPMSVSFDDSGKMSVCAYTGCWEGTGKVAKDGDFLMLSGQNLKFSTSADMNQNIAITLDRSDNIAMLKAGGFAHPLVCKTGGQNVDTPTFEDHKVNVFDGQPKPIKFSGNPNARMFRTRLGEALNGGVNFAGHFIFASWGCGTSCLQGAIIDTKTGIVYFPEEIRVMTFGYLDDDEQPLEYEKDSNLFILRGASGEDDNSEEGTYYLVWEGTKFKQVKFVAKKNDFQ